ncbi:NAD(P)-dependent oxidoreductase [Streptomyces sp. NPDC097619]|uniref:NAD-dependent epimerase/dehydratase family protein n=1 Tax=Streptomyces sp. NPDC097619 TaxID=3157228 RepID=UPI003332A1ED
MRVLVIGGAGYVGGLVLPRLAERHELRVLDPRPPAAGGVEHLPGSAADPEALARAVSGMDAVLHMAMAGAADSGAAEAARGFEVNVTSVHLALRAAHEAGIRHAVFLSSFSVYRDLVDRRLDETVPPDATDLYGLTKRLGEEVCRAAVEEWGLSVTALRLAWPTTDEAWPAWALPGADSATHHTEDGTLIPALAATDLAAALCAALEPREGFRVFHVTGGDANGRWPLTEAARHLHWTPGRR